MRLLPMRSFADIDKIFADIGRVAVEAGQEWERYREMEIALRGVVQYGRIYISTRPVVPAPE